MSIYITGCDDCEYAVECSDCGDVKDASDRYEAEAWAETHSCLKAPGHTPREAYQGLLDELAAKVVAP